MVREYFEIVKNWIAVNVKGELVQPLLWCFGFWVLWESLTPFGRKLLIFVFAVFFVDRFWPKS